MRLGRVEDEPRHGDTFLLSAWKTGANIDNLEKWLCLFIPSTRANSKY